jgi:hypothetical protein
MPNNSLPLTVKPKKAAKRGPRAKPGTFGIVRGPFVLIAEKISKLMKDLRLSSADLQERCGRSAAWLQQLFPQRAYESIHIDDEKIRRLLMWTNPRPRPSALKTIEVEAIEIIAHALNVPADFLLGNRISNRNLICWDPLLDEDQSAHMKILMKTYEEQTREFIGWATFLPCSFETKEFMELHHDAMFSALPPNHKALVVSKFNDIGNSRRLRLFSPKRRYTFTVLICKSDLERIAFGRDEYRLIDPLSRKAALLHMNEILRDYGSTGIGLIVANDEDVDEFKIDMRDNDGVIVMGDQYTQWRLHRGDVLWSENPYWIKRHRRLIEDFCKRAAFSTPAAVRVLLDELAAATN